MMLPHSLNLSFKRYDNLIELHIKQMYAAGTRPDLQKMRFERAKVFEELKNRLTRFIKTSGKSGRDLKAATETCKGRMALILEKDMVLRGKLADYRCEIQEKKKVINNGKTALCGYGQTGLSKAMQRRGVWQG